MNVVADISQLDKNFAGEEIKYEGLKTYNIKEQPFKLYGLHKPYEEEGFKRMPHDVAGKMNKQIQSLYLNTSGARVRFRTDSQRIVLRCIMSKIYNSSHMAQAGSSCFDLYVDGEYFNVFRPGIDATGAHSAKGKREDGFESGFTIGEKKMREILINFPLYSSVTDVFIALDEDAIIEAPTEYTHAKPVVVYGSSITQGACASHPGNSYPLILSRRFDTDIINLGFSSGCKGEDEMAEYLASLDMSVLIYDYDHNGSLSRLIETHERAFKIIREKQPELPVIMVTAADRHFGDEVETRKQVIYATYKNAVEAGDKNVYFIDGQTIFEPVGRQYCTVDDTHANDIGFLMMANAIGELLGEILKRKERE